MGLPSRGRAEENVGAIHNGDELEVSNGNRLDLPDVFCCASGCFSRGTAWFCPAARCVHRAEAGLLLVVLCPGQLEQWAVPGALGFLWKLLCETETRGLACAIGLRASWPAQLGQLLLVSFLLVKEISCVDMGSPVLRALVQVSRCGATGAASRTPEGWFHFKLCHCDFLPMH